AGHWAVQRELDAAPIATQNGRQRGLDDVQGGLGRRVILIGGRRRNRLFIDDQAGVAQEVRFVVQVNETVFTYLCAGKREHEVRLQRPQHLIGVGLADA